MTPILNASIQGYTAAQIISFISNLYPALSPKIKKAKQAGYNVNQILDFVSKTMEGGKASPHLSQSELEAQKMARQSGLTKDILKGALATGAGAFGISALKQMMPQVAQNMMQGAPTPPAGPDPIQTTPNPMPPIGPAMGTTVPQPPPPQTAVVPPPQGGQTPLPPQTPNAPQKFTGAADILEQFGLRKIAENLRAQGKEPEIISAVLAKTLKGEDRARFGELMKSGQVPPFQELVRQFISESPPAKVLKLPEDKGFKFGGLLEPVDAPIIKPEDYQVPEEERPPIKRGSLVIKPDGSIGEVKGEDKSGALVETNGKASKVPLDDLIESPLSEDDLADLYDDLISGIGKATGKKVSANVEYAAYDPKFKELLYKPHGSDKFWVYDDISEQDQHELTNLLTLRKTTGENFINAWEAGTESPIGAAMSKLIRRLQSERGGKGNEYRNRFESIYDALEPAKLAAKKRYERRKKEAKKPRIS